MKLFLAVHNDGNISTSLHPIQETGAESMEIDADEDVFVKIKAGTHKWAFTKGGKLGLQETDLPKKVEAQNKASLKEFNDRQVLKDKLQSGVATEEDIKQALLKLL
jgi:hypothetical protein